MGRGLGGAYRVYFFTRDLRLGSASVVYFRGIPDPGIAQSTPARTSVPVLTSPCDATPATKVRTFASRSCQ
eukprot:3919982-Pyramimonas_sp.AAC.1